MAGRYIGSIEVITPIIGGINKKVTNFRLFKKGNIEFVIYRTDANKTKEWIIELVKNGLIEEDLANKILEKLDRITGPISEPIYEEIKKLLYHNGWVDIDYMFHRNFDTLEIDFFKDLVRPLYYVLTKNGWGIEQIEAIVPQKVSIGTYFTYVGKTNSPVIYETIEKGSKFAIVFRALNEGPTEIETNIRRMRKLGFGNIRIIIRKFQNNKQ
uniref:Uncharacterized protein n=1 Tax=Ignisphaera aggregans TaxID=334771 RepID=A0A7C5YW70_9CREN